ncbi:hypothetical protein Bca101_063545 [Brassica carinata]
MEKLSSAAVVPQLLRNVIIAVVVFADESLLQISANSKLLERLRLFLVACFLFFLRSIPSVVSFANSNPGYSFTAEKKKRKLEIGDCASESGIGRAIWQLLSAMNEIPVNSRKYEVVRSLAERLIDENHGQNSLALFELNRRVLNASFRRTLGRLEAAVEKNRSGPVRSGLNRVVRAAVRAVGDGFSSWGGEEEAVDQSAETAEKLAAELLWLAEKMSLLLNNKDLMNPSWIMILKDKALLFKEAAAGGEKWGEIKKKMLISWLPLLCRASNGSDKPVLRSAERAELAKVLEKMISELEEEEQEQVLSLWLHHYTACSSSDWPDLNGSYVRWCHSSRKLLLLNCDDSQTKSLTN